MTLRKPAFFLGLILALLSGCAAEEATPALGGADAVAEFESALQRALCDVNARCDIGLTSADRETCLSIKMTMPAGRSGFVELDTNQAAKCLDGLNGLACEDAGQVLYDDFGYVQWECPRAFKGTLAEGEPCTSPYECAGELQCMGIGLGQCGACARVGVPCIVGGGDPGPNGSDEVCTLFERCDSSTGKCAPKLADGASCVSSRDCELEHSCAQGVCAPPLGLGETCGEQPDGRVCSQDLQCKEGVCSRLVYGRREGETCGEPGDCGNGLECDRDQRVCVPMASEGEACGAGRCKFGWYCEGTCKPSKETGAACGAPTTTGLLRGAAECLSSLCVDGVCATAPVTTCD
ncbi:MAG: hypothetical protein AUK47_12080 [Deltaproteobacteria bacterium CG2_30_63_29]|nr:MAG: hypothetical protein AUK47_12080 [Deltaproteobacteria bacterium CG2_30_63_29]PJB47696.1 MAG: hypothetical protein CO108_03625 [Deltaproteobacteria bacterium CG_4_9_14_3_um_filter_63_12]